MRGDTAIGTPGTPQARYNELRTALGGESLGDVTWEQLLDQVTKLARLAPAAQVDKLDILQEELVNAATEALRPSTVNSGSGQLARLPDLRQAGELVDTLSRFLDTRERMNEVKTGVRMSQTTLEVLHHLLRAQLGLGHVPGALLDEDAHAAMDDVERCLRAVKGG
jgi:hypothetical protein